MEDIFESAGAEALICELDLSKIESAQTLVKPPPSASAGLTPYWNCRAVSQIDLFGNDGRAVAGRYRKGATAMRNFV